MSLGLAFWILMLLWLVFRAWQTWPQVGIGIAGDFMLFILFLLLGWHAFGPPIHG